jgi:hypothetical protein
MIKHQFPDYDSEIETKSIISSIKDDLYRLKEELKKMKVLIQQIEDKLNNKKEMYDV